MSKHIFKYMFAGVMALAVMSCDKESVTIPVSLDQQSITATPGEGTVTIGWSIPNNPDYQYVRVTYTIPETGKEFMKSASPFADEIVIDHLLARYGTIDFKIETVSEDGGVGLNVCQISAKCDPVRADLSYQQAGNITLSEDEIWGDIGEYYEGPIANLVDGDVNSFYHTCWSGYMVTYDDQGWGWYEDVLPADRVDWWAPPTYIVVKMPKKINAFTFSITNRNNGNRSNPGTIELYTSDSFNPSSVTSFDETIPAYNARYVTTVSDLPAEQGASWTSGVIYYPDGLSDYLWFKVTKITRDDIDYIAVSELSVMEYSVSIYDAESDPDY